MANFNTQLTKAQIITALNNGLDAVSEQELEAALLLKQNALSTAQLAAVNSGITASKLTADESALTRLVNSGGKNFLKLTDTSTDTKKGVTITYNSDGTYTIDSDGSASSGADYFYLARSASNPLFPKDSVISGCTGGSDSTYYLGIAGTTVKQGNDAVTLSADTSGSLIFSFASGVTFDNLVIRPMVCTAADWAVSEQFEPYCPTLAELYAMFLAL